MTSDHFVQIAISIVVAVPTRSFRSLSLVAPGKRTARTAGQGG